jgi:hypothetical protein
LAQLGQGQIELLSQGNPQLLGGQQLKTRQRSACGRAGMVRPSMQHKSSKHDRDIRGFAETAIHSLSPSNPPKYSYQGAALVFPLFAARKCLAAATEFLSAGDEFVALQSEAPTRLP